MKILLTGARGQVGWELRRTLATLGTVVATDSQSLDLTRSDVIRSRIRELKPDIIVNPAAYTAVDKAESDPDVARAVNAMAPRVLAEEAASLGALLVHYSTDYVFDGRGDAPWQESDATAPLNIYGASKLEGEQAIQAVGGRYLIFRTSWVYGNRGANFLLTMQRLMRERAELKIVADQVGAPTWCRSIAEATAQVLAQVAVSPVTSIVESSNPVWGIYHMTNAGETSWHGFALAIAEEGGLGTQLLPIPTKSYPTPAKRPLNSRLDNARLAETFGIRLPDWRSALQMCVDQN